MKLFEMRAAIFRFVLSAAACMAMAPALCAQNCNQFYSASQGDMAGVVASLNSGCDVNAFDAQNHLPALIYAVQGKHTDVALLLLQRGANPNVVKEDSWTPLDIVSDPRFGGDPRLLEALLDHGAQVNNENNYHWTPLMYACTNPSDTTLIEILLAHNADPNAHTPDGLTPMDIATQNALSANPTLPYKALQLLLAYGANPNQNETGINPWLLPMDSLVSGKTPEDKQLLAMMLTAGADPNSSLLGDGTPILWNALQNDDPDIAVMLIKAGANWKVVNSQHEPYMLNAACSKGPAFISALASSGVDFSWHAPDGVSWQPACWTRENLFAFVDASVYLDGTRSENPGVGIWKVSPLENAPILTADTIKAMLDAGADLPSLDIAGNNPMLPDQNLLPPAAMESPDKANVFQLLIEYGEDPRGGDSAGSTILHTLDLEHVGKDVDEQTAVKDTDEQYRAARAVLVSAIDARMVTEGFLASAYSQLQASQPDARPLLSRQLFLEALNLYRKDPYSIELRVFLAGLGGTIDNLPPPPAAALQHERAAQAAYAKASRRSDMLGVAAEYEQALTIAPWVRAYYKNLCTVYELSGSYGRARRYGLMYMSTDPPDKQVFQKQIDRLNSEIATATVNP